MSYLTVVDGEVKMMQGVVCRTVNDVFQWVAGYHIRVVDLCSSIVISGGSDTPVQRTNMLQKLTKTKRPRYRYRWRGNMKINRWYGTDCRYPSTGWNAWDAKGVGTAANGEWMRMRGRVMTYLSTCGVVYAVFCRGSGGGESDVPSKWHNR